MCEHGEHHRHQDCGCETHGHGQEHDACGCETSGHAQERDECGCGKPHAFHHQHPRAGGCGCGQHGDPRRPGFVFRRHFATREERMAWLERYLQDLKAEAQAVEERIAEMKAGQEVLER